MRLRGTILNIAHRAMESRYRTIKGDSSKDSLMPRFSQLVYNGFWFSPEMEILLEMGRPKNWSAEPFMALSRKLYGHRKEIG